MSQSKSVNSVSIIGLGKLGSPMVACFAAKSYRVIGVDVNESTVDFINNGRSPVQEPQLAHLLNKYCERISATTDYTAAVLNSEITFIIVPTPTDETGGFSTKLVAASAARIGDALRRKTEWHLVVLTSTVLPGATESVVIPTLERHSGKKCGKDFGFCYNPEFIALGSVIHNIFNPDFTLIGEADRRSGDLLEQFYRTIVDNNAPAKRMNLVNAELTKISVNTFVTTKISYANMLAEVCELLPGANVDVVTDALGTDKRIGHKYLKGATAYGGPCFPRDNVAFSFMAGKLGVEPSLAEATDYVNRRQARHLMKHLVARLPRRAKVAVLGLAYKVDTPVVEESQGINLVRLLLDGGFVVAVYDPLAMDEARRELGNTPTYATSVQECVQQADAVVIVIPDAEFKKLESIDLSPLKVERAVILDAWRILDQAKFSGVSDYVAGGVGVTIIAPQK